MQISFPTWLSFTILFEIGGRLAGGDKIDKVNEIIYQTLLMLAQRYDEEHNVTIQRVLNKYLRGIRSRSVSNRLYKMGIIEPRYDTDLPERATVWRINIPTMHEYIQKYEHEISLEEGWSTFF